MVGTSWPSWFPRTSYSTPHTAPEASVSCARRAASGGPEISWCPASPFVTLTKRTTCPRCRYKAATPPALISQSSGWAPITRMRSGDEVWVDTGENPTRIFRSPRREVNSADLYVSSVGTFRQLRRGGLEMTNDEIRMTKKAPCRMPCCRLSGLMWFMASRRV